MILLVDMDAFFASVEQAYHPHLRGKAVIVCGDPSRRGVVTAASYEARPFGVRAGMPTAEAKRLCPDAEFVEGSPRKYVEKSLELLELFLTYTPDVEPFSVDEAFLDLGKLGARGATREAAIAMAREIQQRITDEHGLSASIGIGPNKLIAKMASGVNKPRGLTPLDEEEFRRLFWPMDVQELWGVGPKMSEHLKRMGIATVGDLGRAAESQLEQSFGLIGPHLRNAAWGRDQTPVIPYHEGVDPKSMGHEVTLPEDCREDAFLEGTLLRLSDQVARRLRGDGFVSRTLTLKLRDFRFRTITRQRALTVAVDDHLAIFEVVRSLWRANWKGEPLRLLGVSAGALEHKGEGEQGELFSTDDRKKTLQAALDQVRDKLGEASVVPAGSLMHRGTSGHVPFGAMKRKDPGSLSREARKEPGKP
ncbi:MAG: DNA polymerase IV [Candidatus Eisenbacteria bacterium]|nr:DNA polymerase IV [Candidatus Eisenbacteria bacterium]